MVGITRHYMFKTKDVCLCAFKKRLTDHNLVKKVKKEYKSKKKFQLSDGEMIVRPVSFAL